MPWQKGQSGNPAGRAKNETARKMLIEALEKAAKTNRKTLMEHAIEQAYKDNTVLVAVLRKLVPDLKSIEGRLDAVGSLEQFLDFLRGRINGNGNGDKAGSD